MAKEKYNWPDIFKKIDSGYSYSEIEKEYGVNYHTISRKYRTYKAGEIAAKDDKWEKETLDNIANKTLRLMSVQKQNTHLRRVANKVAGELAIVDMIMESFVVPSIKPYTPKKFNLQGVKTKNGAQLFFITDTHFATMEHSKSIKDFGKMVVENWDGSSKIILVFGGDYIENRHHQDQVIRTTSAMQQAIDCADLHAQAIADILVNTGAIVETHFLVGNHDEIRQGNEKSGDNLKENIVGMLSKTIGLLLAKYENYKTVTDSTYELILTHGGKKFNFRHGHMGFIADKALQDKMLKDELQTGVVFDHYVVGHFHRWNDWTVKGTSKRFTICPAMKTYDGNFENSRVLRSTVGITMFNENGQTSFIEWKGKKTLDGELRNN